MTDGSGRPLVGMVYDLRSQYLAEGFSEADVAEFDSDVTIEALDAAICANGYRVERIGHARDFARRAAAGDRWDLVFSIAEGLHGRNREAQVPCLCELYGFDYVFSDALACAVTLDKSMAKRLVAFAGLRTPRFAVFTAAPVQEPGLAYPLFVKPMFEGTGKGVDANSRVNSFDALVRVCDDLVRRFHQPVLVEEYLPGREFTTGILGTGAAATVLGTMEVVIRKDAPSADYSYTVKELCDQYVDYRPLEHGPLREAVEALALGAHRTLECRDTGRVDTRLDAAGLPSFIEINPLPGLHPHHSDLPMIATQEGMSYHNLIGAILRSAEMRRRAAAGAGSL